jgi:uncharacterized membrane protein YqjE
MAEPQSPPGPAQSLRALGATLAEMIETRAELALVELRELGERRKEALWLAVAGGLFLAMGLLLAAFFVVVYFWDSHRLAAIAGVTLLYLAIAAFAFLRLRAKERASPPPFEATLRELKSDRDMLQGRHE